MSIDNPAFDRVFGETELAQSIREMKAEDPKFRIADFGDEVEHIIAPSVIQYVITPKFTFY